MHTTGKKAMQRRWPLSKPALLLLFSFVYLLTALNELVDIYDEGIVVYGAERVLNGEIPYRDFWTIYSPGQFYVLAGLFKFFGSSIRVERVFDAAVRALLCLLLYLLARRVTPGKLSFVSWLFAVLWLRVAGFHGYSLFTALLFSLISALLVVDFFGPRGRSRFLFAAGVAAGVTVFFRHDFGFYTFAVELLVLVVFALYAPFLKPAGTGIKRPAVGKYLLAYLAGTGAVLAPLLLYFVNWVPLKELTNDLLVFPATIFPTVRFQPYPGPFPDFIQLFAGRGSLLTFFNDFVNRYNYHFPLAVFGWGMVSFVLALRRAKQGTGKAPWHVLFVSLLGFSFFNHSRTRPGISHLLPMLFLSLPVYFALMSSVLEKWGKQRFVFGMTFFALAALLFIMPLKNNWVRWGDFRLLSRMAEHEVPRARYAAMYRNQIAAVTCVQRITSPGERIFVGNNRHDLIYNNDVMFYFLSERPSATQYHELSPGSATSRAVQSEIVEELKRHNIRHIVLLSRFRVPAVTNEPVPVRVLDDFIAQNYRPAQTFGDWSVWEKK